MESTSTFDASLHDKFLKVEEDLLQVDVIFEDNAVTTDYIRRFTILAQSAAHGIAHRLLSDRTLAVVRRVAFNVSFVANNLYELGPRTRAVESKREAEIGTLFARLSLKDDANEPLASSYSSRSAKAPRTFSKAHPSRDTGHSLIRSASEETLVEVEKLKLDKSYNSVLDTGEEKALSHRCLVGKSITCASESVTTLSAELIAPAPTPIPTKPPHSTLDYGTTETAILPHDLSDKPQSNHSVKRALPDTNPDVPYKRARPDRSTYKSRSSEWLLANLHNPYPTHSVKAKLASEAAVSVKTIEDWFTHSRQQIGWTSFMKTYFKGSRAEAVDCAMSVLTGSSARHPTLAGPRDALLAMKSTALALFENRQDVSETVRRIEAELDNRFSCAVVDEESRSKATGRKGAHKAKRVCYNKSSNVGRDQDDDSKRGQEQLSCASKSSRKPPSFKEETHTLLSPPLVNPTFLDEQPRPSLKRRFSSSEAGEEPSRKRHHNYSNLYDCFDTSTPFDFPDIINGGFDAFSMGVPGTLDQTYSDLDNIFDFNEPNSMAGANSDPLEMLRPEDFGNDFADFPGMPDFNIDWTNIRPPSFESLTLPANYMLPISIPNNSDGSSISDSLCLPSASTLVNSPPVHSSALDKLLSHSVDAYLDSRDTFNLACNIESLPPQFMEPLLPKDV